MNSTGADEITMNKKVQEWLDAYEDRNLLPSSQSVTSSTEPTLFIADEHTAVSNDAAIVVSSSSSKDAAIVISSSSSSSSSSDMQVTVMNDMQVTVMNIDRIWKACGSHDESKYLRRGGRRSVRSLCM